MKLSVLTENTAIHPQFRSVHGLSLHLQTKTNTILFDVGPGDEFLSNAELMGIDLTKVDLCAISHGHYDHGGGLSRFMEINTTAPIYLTDLAFEDCFSGSKYIGLDKALAGNPRFRVVTKETRVVPGILLLSKIPGETLLPKANATLLNTAGPDPFLHEQVMLVEEDGLLVLLGGCAHRGIVNILEYVKTTVDRYPNAVVSGFHLAAGGSGKCMADEAYLLELSSRLLATGAMFYSCHCTGSEALQRLQQLMHGKLQAISTGTVLDL